MNRLWVLLVAAAALVAFSAVTATAGDNNFLEVEVPLDQEYSSFVQETEALFGEQTQFPGLVTPLLPPATTSNGDKSSKASKPKITIIQNSNTLNSNDLCDSDSGCGNGGGGNGGNGGNGDGGGGGGNGGDKMRCREFWRRGACPAKSGRIAKNEKKFCVGRECQTVCCTSAATSRVGSCKTYKCPAVTHVRKQGDLDKIGCKTETECRIKCCNRKPISCKTFWSHKDGGCPKKTHNRKPGADQAVCKQYSTHCQNTCCAPKPLTCEIYNEVHGCPAGHTLIWERNDQQCKETHQGAESCWIKCCRAVPEGQGKCNYWGDPHMVSFDGLRWNCYRQGEFVMLETPQESIHNMQIIPPRGLGNQVAYNVGAAFKSGHDRFYLQLRAPQWTQFLVELKCNGKTIRYPDKQTRCGVFRLDPSGALPPANAPEAEFHRPSRFLGVFNTKTGSSMILKFWIHMSTRYMNIEVVPGGRRGQYPTRGMCGSWNGNAHDDFLNRQGQRCPNEDNCCASWQVPAGSSLFAHPPPSKAVHTRDFAPNRVCKQKYAAAKEFCSKLVKPVDLPDCMVEYCLGGGTAADKKVLADELKEMRVGH